MALREVNMPYRKIFVLIFVVTYIAIARAYSASKWTDFSNDHENLHLILFTLVVLTALVAVYLINKNQLMQSSLNRIANRPLGGNRHHY